MCISLHTYWSKCPKSIVYYSLLRLHYSLHPPSMKFDPLEGRARPCCVFAIPRMGGVLGLLPFWSLSVVRVARECINWRDMTKQAAYGIHPQMRCENSVRQMFLAEKWEFSAFHTLFSQSHQWETTMNKEAMLKRTPRYCRRRFIQFYELVSTFQGYLKQSSRNGMCCRDLEYDQTKKCLKIYNKLIYITRCILFDIYDIQKNSF